MLLIDPLAVTRYLTQKQLKEAKSILVLSSRTQCIISPQEQRILRLWREWLRSEVLVRQARLLVGAHKTW